MKILLVDDDESLTKGLTITLTTHHHTVDVAKDGEMAGTYASPFESDLMGFEVMLPILDGISLCQRCRANGSDKHSSRGHPV